MIVYKELKTGTLVEISGDKFAFPTTGVNILTKPRPPIAHEHGTD